MAIGLGSGLPLHFRSVRIPGVSRCQPRRETISSELYSCCPARISCVDRCGRHPQHLKTRRPRPPPSRWLVSSRTALLSYLLSRLIRDFPLFSVSLSPRPPPESLLLLSISSSLTTLALRATVSSTARASRSSCTTASRSMARLVSSVTTSRSSGMVRFGVLPSLCPAAQPASSQVTLRLP